MGVDLLVIDDVVLVGGSIVREFQFCGVIWGILEVVGNGLKMGAYEKEGSG